MTHRVDVRVKNRSTSRYLCVVTPEGLMSVYRDDVLVGEASTIFGPNPHDPGETPLSIARKQIDRGGLSDQWGK